MYFEEFVVGKQIKIVELTFEVFNQNNELVLTDVTEMIVKCRP